MKNTMKTMMAAAAFALFAGNTKASTVSNTVVAPYDKSDCGAICDMYRDRDWQALAQFVQDGRGYIIKAGATVSLMDVDIFGGVDKVRAAGQSRGVWIPLEFYKR